MSFRQHILGLATGGTFVSLLAVLGASAPPGASNGQYSVTITNLTANQIISPPLVVSHDEDADVFEPGTPASPQLADVAENGNNVPLRDLLMSAEGVFDVVALEDGLPPGQSVTVILGATNRFARVSAVGMLVSSNDAFFGLDSVLIPTKKKQPVVVYVPAYDSGTEANSEDCAFVPGPPCGAGPVHDPSMAEGFVHIGNGIRGIGGIPADTYDWSNPVVRVVIERL